MNLGRSCRHYQHTLLIVRTNIKGIIALLRHIINSKGSSPQRPSLALKGLKYPQPGQPPPWPTCSSTIPKCTWVLPLPFSPPSTCKYIQGLKEELPTDQFLWQLSPSQCTWDTSQNYSGLTKATFTWLALELAPSFNTDGGLVSWPTLIIVQRDEEILPGFTKVNGSRSILSILAYSATAISTSHFPKYLCTIARVGEYLSQISKFRLGCTVMSTVSVIINDPSLNFVPKFHTRVMNCWTHFSNCICAWLELRKSEILRFIDLESLCILAVLVSKF